MELEEIVNKAIPIKPGDCRLVRAEKEFQRKTLTERIKQYAKEQANGRSGV